MRRLWRFLREVPHLGGHVRELRASQDAVQREVDALLQLTGAAEARRVRGSTGSDLRDAEFRVYSQWGQDGIIQFLLGHVAIESRTFVEIGVEDYRECNTRFLLVNDGWAGAAVDAGEAHVRFLESSGLRWRYPIHPVSAFVTRDNVNDVIASSGLAGDIGLLSLDIDGNDYWVLRALDVVTPRIVIVEYNSVFGPDARVSVPYEPAFDRTAAHHSNLYFGASLRALHELMVGVNGYRFVGCNAAGNDAFFVRDDVAADLRGLSVEEGYVRSRFREARDAAGRLRYVAGHDVVADVGHLPVVDPVTGVTMTVDDALA